MIYCVEDDSAIRDLMLYTLNASGYSAKGFPDSTDFWKAIQEERPELILLDIMLPGEDGICILKKLRASPMTSDIPVLMATARGSEFDKVIGLDSGADDYLVKPFGMMEMVARIKAVLRRTSPKPVTVLTCGDIVLDEGKHLVTVSGKQTALTLKEYELLKLLMENPGQVFTREVLLSRIWGQDYLGETRTVDVHIGTLRTKLAGSGELIETVRGVGYKMVEKHEQENL
ncbi:MAG: response regulator transcription factor [Candidatus Faecousia sp.]|nr:response regulator transcription factor [Candidatus Faecousia sp.]